MSNNFVYTASPTYSEDFEEEASEKSAEQEPQEKVNGMFILMRFNIFLIIHL